MREVYSKYVCCPHSLDRNLCLLQKFVSFKSTASFHVESCHFARSATYYIRSPAFSPRFCHFCNFSLRIHLPSLLFLDRSWGTVYFLSIYISSRRHSSLVFTNAYFFLPWHLSLLFSSRFISVYSFLIVIFISAIIIPILSQSSRLALIAI